MRPAAAAAIAIASSVALASAFSAVKKKRSDIDSSSSSQLFRVPNEILESTTCKCKDELVLAVQMALEAGKNMTKHYDSKGTAEENMNDLQINTKMNDADFATAIDVENENYISTEIRKMFPDHAIIGEESTGTGTIPPLTDVPTWIIDPIDGTTNFAAGLPLSCVSIGFCVEGKPYMGVVFAPMTNELYIGVQGHGAYRNGVRLLECSGEKATKTLSHSVVNFEFGYARNEEDVDKMAAAVQRLLRHGVRTTRTLGSGVLDLCYVSCGRMDVVYTGIAAEGWKPWDYCAGLVIAVEAGCTMTHLSPSEMDKKGYDFDLYSKNMICGVKSNVVDECRKVVLGL
jgi:inositol-phosphate phosphatase/L-galactose 1-phosphate phosphatase